MSSAETPDFVALDRLQRRYADCVSRRSWTELSELFEPDCRVELDLRDRVLAFEGGGAIADFIDQAIAGFDFFVFSILTVGGPGGTRIVLLDATPNSRAAYATP